MCFLVNFIEVVIDDDKVVDAVGCTPDPLKLVFLVLLMELFGCHDVIVCV